MSRRDRLLPRLWKLAILAGVVGILAEGVLELPRLTGPLLAPPSVPGAAKIIEHFVVQHLAFPALGLALVFAPLRLGGLFAQRGVAVCIAALAILVSIPEVIVSATDLFRPYPFPLPAALRGIEVAAGINLLQAQHLVFVHGALMGSLAAIALASLAGATPLPRLAGPRTGGR